jgi:hypothetical protein
MTLVRRIACGQYTVASTLTDARQSRSRRAYWHVEANRRPQIHLGPRYSNPMHALPHYLLDTSINPTRRGSLA